MTMIILPILLPLILAALVPLLRKNTKALAAMPLVAGGLGVLTFLGALSASPTTVSQSWVGPFSFDFSLDSWKLLLLGFVVLFEVMTGIYALKSIPRTPRAGLFTAAVLIAFASAAGVVLTENVLILLIFWEMFLLALYGAIHAGGDQAERVAQKALIIGGASDFLMILGLMVYLTIGGQATFGQPIEIGSSRMALTAFVLIFLGAGAKAGMFPFHTWIPEAAEVMPGTGFAALPASLEKILGISFLYTLTSKMFVINGAARGIMLAFAVITAFVVILPAMVEKNLKKVLALTAISPVGFMIAGMATAEAAGMIGALMYMLTHATYKSGMFFAADAFETHAGSNKLEDLQGVGRALPACGWGFVLAFFAAISLPPTGGFMAKEFIFEGLLARGNGLVLALLVIAAIINIAVFCKLVAVIMGRGANQPIVAPMAERMPGFFLGLAAFLTGLVFTLHASAFTFRLPTESGHFSVLGVWHIGPLTMLSLAIYLFGFMVYFSARSRVEVAAATFDGLSSSPVTGAGLAMAAEKRFDAYEIGLKVVDFITRGVFRYFERQIDVVVDGIIAFGRGISKHFLSAVHNGVYANYLGWAVAGFVAVLGLLFLL